MHWSTHQIGSQFPLFPEDAKVDEARKESQEEENERHNDSQDSRQASPAFEQSVGPDETVETEDADDRNDDFQQYGYWLQNNVKLQIPFVFANPCKSWISGSVPL